MSPGKLGSGKRKKAYRWLSLKFHVKRAPAKTVPVDLDVEQSDDAIVDESGSFELISTVEELVISQSPEKSIENLCGNRLATISDDRSGSTCRNSVILPDRRRLNIAITSPKMSVVASTIFNDPPLIRNKRVGKLGKSCGGAGNFDSFIGLSIVTMTLLVTVMCGRLCAVLCTSACFYFIPWLRTATAATVKTKSLSSGGCGGGKIGGVNLKIGDVCSFEFKNKVVLNGFLDRNRRCNG